jgi:hypothetical protein
MKKTIVAFLTLCLFISPIAILAQRKPIVPAKPKAVVTDQAKSGKLAYLEPSPKSKFMSRSWFAGKLPEPFELPVSATKVEDASLLAKMTAAGDERSMSAVVAALLEMGFAIEKPDGKRQKTTGAQGISIPEWQIAGAAKLYGQENAFGLDVFESALKRTVPQFKNVKLAQLLLEDIRLSLKSNVPSTRFWANYIVGLGKNQAKPYDLTNAAIDPNEVRIDPLQNLLILTRLAGDLSPLDKKLRGENKVSNADLFRNASYSAERTSYPFTSPIDNLSAFDETGSCSIESNTSILFDYDAVAVGAGFTKVVDAFIKGLNDIGNTARATQIGNIIKGFGYANIFLNLAKFLITLASVEVKISMDGDSLTRTRTKTAGERKQLKAELTTDTGKYLQMVNCVRPLLNLIGVDASVPTNGPLSNIKVTWVLLDESDTFDAALHNLNLDGTPTSGNDQNSSSSGGVHLVGTADNFTDQNGIARIDVIGEPQDRDLSKEKLTQTQRTVRVATYFQTKTTDPKSTTETVSTIGDFLGPTVSLLLGDKLGGIAGFALETAYRATWCPSNPYSFTIKDWLPCTDGWEGTVTMQRTQTAKVEINATKGSIKKSMDVNVIEMQAKVLPIDGLVKGMASVSDTTNSSYTDENTGFCTQNIRVIGAKSGGGASTINGTIKIDGGQFTIILTTDNELVTTMNQKTTFDGSCPDAKGEPRSETITGKQKYAIAVTDKFDPSNPYELKGSKTVVENDTGGEIRTTYTWNLRKCH